MTNTLVLFTRADGLTFETTSQTGAFGDARCSRCLARVAPERVAAHECRTFEVMEAELPRLRAAYDAARQTDDDDAIAQASAALNGLYAAMRQYLKEQRQAVYGEPACTIS